jgi:hypothetical protein
VQDSAFLENTGVASGAIYVDEGWATQIVETSVFIGNEGGNGGAIAMGGKGIMALRDCVFAENRTNDPVGGGGAVIAGDDLEITGCTFWGNHQAFNVVGGTAVFGGGGMKLERSIFAHNTGTEAVRAEWFSPGGCNDYWDNPEGNLDGPAHYPTDVFVDPLFCDPEIGDWTLRVGSPCLPEGSGGCGLIGALGQGCGTVSVTPISWGRIKELYR